MQYAHKKRVVHRALSPRSVLVLDADSEQSRGSKFSTGRPGIGRRQTQPGATQGITATSHVGQLVDDPTTAYMAPDVLVPGESLGEHLDVFSLGAVAYHILSGHSAGGRRGGTRLGHSQDPRPPAGSCARRRRRPALRPDPLRYAPRRGPAIRHGRPTFSNTSILPRRSSPSPAGDEVENPVEAQVGDILPGGLRVERRIGQGSCSIAAARDPQRHERRHRGA
jgi:serine/threonine protein kinase